MTDVAVFIDDIFGVGDGVCCSLRVFDEVGI
jgi:hypothetical protein